ncbi:hypothetical protein PL263_12420 [Methylomonas sp. EFPC3]|uniref:hypothetical protein n=1 Tax=Methylomonas sp. EFPC3 TaxID=3021710 RepID=UPI0024161B53|nr:hypothetical protein [Methylomonas sp. EFPC3]WFP48910.1 hypothetical protein PL263_12420 [Methylomonas sp. EFPC3]
MELGQPTGRCPFGVVRKGAGNAEVRINRNGRGERRIEFISGQPAFYDDNLTLIFERSGDLFLIRIGNEERYGIPEAVVTGG